MPSKYRWSPNSLSVLGQVPVVLRWDRWSTWNWGKRPSSHFSESLTPFAYLSSFQLLSFPSNLTSKKSAWKQPKHPTPGNCLSTFWYIWTIRHCATFEMQKVEVYGLIGKRVQDIVASRTVYVLPWSLSGKESTCQWRRREFHPWARKSPWRRKQQPTPVLLPGKSYGQRRLAGYSPWGTKSQTWLID